MGNRHGKILACSHGWATALGYEREELLKVNWQRQLTAPESLEHEAACLKDLSAGKPFCHYPKLYKHRQGRYLAARVTAVSLQPTCREDLILFQVSFNDPWHQVDSALQELHKVKAECEEYRSLLNSINQLIYTYDLSGEITFVNDKSVDLLGYPPCEVVGRNLWDFVVDRYRTDFIEQLQHRIERGGVDTYLITVQHRDGSERILEFRASPMVKNGQLLGEMALAEDVTESRRLEKAWRQSNQTLLRMREELMAANQQLIATEEELRRQLDESEKNRDALADAHQRLETILNFLPDPTYVVDSRGQVQIWNHAMEELTGLKARDMLGRGNFEYAIPFFGRRRPMLIDMSMDPFRREPEGISIKKEENDTLFAEFFCPQLGMSGAYLSCKSSPLRDRSGNLVEAIETIRDVTERRMAEKALFESEQRYRNIIERIEDGYFEVDLEGNFQLLNRSLHEKLGYRAEEFLGLNYRAVMDDLNANRVKTTFNRVYLTGKPVREFEWYVIRKDGSEMVVESTVLPIIENDAVVGFRGVIRDITDRKKAEEAWQASEANLRKQVDYLNTLIDNLHEMFFTYDLHGCMLFVNKRAHDLIGYSPEELIGRHIADFVTDSHRTMVYDRIRMRLEEGSRGSYELPVIHKSGSERVIKLNASPMYGDDHSIIGGMVLAEDITERKQVQQALEISEAQYRAIVEDQTELICRYLPDGTLTFVNEAYCRYFNLERDRIISGPFQPPIHPDERKRVSGIINELCPQNPSCTLEYQMITPSREVRWLQWTHRAIFDPSGRVSHYQSVGRDITEQKKAEEKLTYLSQHDFLTGLYNRLYFEEELKRKEHSPEPSGLIMCDVDGLKLVNDTLGHEQGDRLLRVVSEVMRTCFRENDILARVGGDEFAAIIPNATRKLLEERIQLIRSAVLAYNDLNRDFPISLSLGCALRKDVSVPMTELFKDADNNMYREKLHSGRSARSAIVQTLMKALEARDFITEGHADRLQELVEGVARSIRLPDRAVHDLRLLAQFHDIGKVGVPDSILFKPGSLTEEEFQVMQRHCEIGHRIALSAPELLLIADWILKHHEWWNGQGYPLGLTGEDIPLECRILSIADAFDAMTNDRPYRQAMSEQAALNELRRYAGVQFDPQLVEVFITVIEGWKTDSESDR